MKKLSLIATIAFCSYSIPALAVKVTMPRPRIIKRWLHQAGSNYLAKHTTIVVDLAGQQKEALEIAAIVENAFIQYALALPADEFPSLVSSPSLCNIGPETVQNLLQYIPKARRELKELGRI